MHNTQNTDIFKTILVVDDRQGTLDATVGTLKTMGYSCQGCCTGEEALKLLGDSDGGFSVCILDQELKTESDLRQVTLSGMDTLAAIKAQYPRTRVIVFTAFENRGIEAVQKGASFYVHKPVSGFHLATQVDALVKMRALEDSVALAASKRDMLQGIIDAMGVEIMVRDLDFNIILINEKKKKVCGIDDSVVGSKCYDVFYLNGCSMDSCPTDFAATEREIIQREMTVDDKTFLVNAGPIVDSKGMAKYIAEVTIDITKRKKAIRILEELQEKVISPTEDLAKLIVNLLHEFGYPRTRIYLMHEDGLYLHAHCGMADNLGIDQYKLTANDDYAKQAFDSGRPQLITDFTNDPCRDPLDKAGVTAQLQIPLLSGKTKLGLISIDNKDSDRPLTEEDLDIMALLGACMASAIQSSQAVAEKDIRIGWLQIIRDIDSQLTVARNTKNVFQAVADALKQVLGADSTWVLIRDETGQSLRTGAIAGDLRDINLGYHPGNIGVVGRCLEKNATQIVPNVWVDQDFRDYYASLKENDAQKQYVKERSALIVVPIRCGETAIGACIAHFSNNGYQLVRYQQEFVEDIAARAAMALAKLDEQQQIEAIAVENAKLSDITLLGAGIAHSVRTPIAGALKAVELAETDEISDYARSKLSEAIKQLMKTTEMIDRLIGFTRPECRMPTYISLDVLVKEVIEITRDKLKYGKIELKLTVGKSVNQVYVTPDHLKMAILDLFVNAVRAMPTGGRLSISIANVDGCPAVALKIADTGAGMTEQQLKNLFFWSVDKGAPTGGIGLGLYLAKRVIGAHGGTISCESTLGNGTVFTVILPTEEQQFNETKNSTSC